MKYWNESWNVLIGCQECSPGCRNCWARGMVERFPETWGAGLVIDGEWSALEHYRLNDLEKPLRWRKPRVVAMNWMGDLFWNDKLRGGIYSDVFEIAQRCAQHQFLFLTKRPRAMARAVWTQDRPGGNIWHGLTVCTQQEADDKLPVFLQIPGKKWLSVEPMLERILIPPEYLRQLSWVVIGAETGPGALPFHHAWIRYFFNREGTKAYAPVLVKQRDAKGFRTKSWSENMYPPEIAEILGR